MAGPIHGSIEHLFLGTSQGSGSAQSFFVNVYNFLNNNTGTLGIRRIAYNSGSTDSGMIATTRGMHYYDQALPCGDNAWACFQFQSASNPFNVLIQWTGVNDSFGSNPGSPGLFKNAGSNNVFGIAFATRVDGGDPWNGSSGSNGSDTKGTPVWRTGGSSLVMSPRSNDPVRGGSHGSSKQNMQGFNVNSGADYRQSMIADYDNFVIMLDAGNTNNYQVNMIGVYTPLSGVNPNVSWVSMNETSLPLEDATNYGDTAGSTSHQGAMGYPNVALSGTCITAMNRYTSVGFFQNTNAQPNRAFATPTFDEFPLLVGIFETPNQVGATGQIFDFYREAYNVSSQDTNSDGSRAAFGTTTLATVKLTIPWSIATVPGSGVARTGVQF